MSVIDLTPFFIKAHSQSSNWSIDELKKILSSIPKLIPDATIDWDTGAGEDWVTIRQSKKDFGIIRVDIPIAFFLNECSDAVSQLLARHNVKLIPIESFSERQFKLDRHQVQEIIPGGWHADSDAVNMDSLSIADLWYATI